jgi:hypothetical protein
MSNTWAWDQVLDELQLQLPKATFDTWLKGTTAQYAGDTLVITVANAYALDWLEHRLRPNIERAVAAVAGQPLQVTFTVKTTTDGRPPTLRPAPPCAEHRPGTGRDEGCRDGTQGGAADDGPPSPEEAAVGGPSSAVAHYEIWAPADPTVLRILPDLAEEIGLNESIVLLQLDYWIRHSHHVRDGRRWTYQSVRDMQRKAFKWWSLDTINRAIASLVRQQLILVTDKYNQHKHDRTRWFALNPEGFRRLKSVELKPAADQ